MTTTATALIEFKDDNIRQEVIIKISHDYVEHEDDNIFFYVGSEKELIGLMDELTCEDFRVIKYKLNREV